MKPRDPASGKSGWEAKTIVSALATSLVMIVLALLASGDGRGDPPGEHDPKMLAIKNLCSSVRLFYGNADAETLDRVDGPTLERCRTAVIHYEEAIQRYATAPSMAENPTEGIERKTVHRDEVLRIEKAAVSVLGEFCRIMFQPTPTRDLDQGRYTCVWGASASSSSGRQVLEPGEEQILGNGTDDFEECADWPLHQPPEIPLVKKLLTKADISSRRWPDVAQKLTSLGFGCLSSQTDCYGTSSFVSLRGPDVLATGDTYIRIRLVDGRDADSVQREVAERQSHPLGTDTRLCVSTFNMQLP